MHALQCPRCEIRYATASELNDHLAIDHPDFHALATNVENDLLGACHCHHDPGPHPHHLLSAPRDAA